MISALIYSVCYFLIIAAIFLLVQRPLFMYYNRKSNPQNMTITTFKTIVRKGVYTDFIAAAYTAAIPSILVWIGAFTGCSWMTAILSVFNVIIALLLSLLIIADTALYKFWEFKIEASVLAYLRSPKEAFASVTGSYIIMALLAWLLMFLVVFCPVQALTMALVPNMAPITGWGYAVGALLFLLWVVVLFLTIRGLNFRPNNPSMAFFCNVPFFNHSSLNPMYNFIYSAFNYKDFGKQFQAFDKDTCQKEFAKMFPTEGTPQTELLNTKTPNILFIIWESLCARYVSTLGGVAATPNIDRLAKEGVLFTHCDAGSFRTDRGIICLLSGYLGQPTTSIIKYTHKLPHLPALPRRLKELGYSTLVMHGGSLTVMHKSDYYLAVGHDKMVEMKDFPSSAPKCKWGIHDNYMFEQLYESIMQKTKNGEKWFTTFQTLSSHEPFIVPYKQPELKDPAANAFAFTDHCFGELVDKLKATDAWKDLLIVCVGDHGLNLAGEVPRDKYPHIPLLLIGGAVKEPRRIDTIMSQTDLAATLLGQLGLEHKEFIFSRDVLADTYTYPFGFHTYTNGFLFRDATGFTHYDNDAKCAVNGADEEREHKGKVILQQLYQDLSQR